MKQYFLLIAILSCLNMPVFSQSAADYYKIASDYYDKGDYNNAVIIINKALLKDSTNAEYLLLKGNALESDNKLQESFETFSFAISIHPKNAIFYNQRGLILKRVLETEYAIKDFTKALEFEKADTSKLTLLLNRGACKIDRRDFQGAYDDFMAALKFDTLNIGALNNLASVCDEVGKGELTLPYLFKILKIDSTSIPAYVNIGFKYQESGDHKKAISYFDKVLQLSPDEPLAYSNRSFNRYKLGDYKGAMSDINTSLKLYRTNSYAYRNRALILIAENEIEKACGDIEEALRLGFTQMYGAEMEELKSKHCK